MLTSKAITTRLLYISDLILTKLCFLHEDLGEGPADPPYEGCQQHHDEALQVKLGWLKCKHKQTTRDQQDHQDQEWILLGKGQKRQQETAGENNWSCVCKKNGMTIHLLQPSCISSKILNFLFFYLHDIQQSKSICSYMHTEHSHSPKMSVKQSNINQVVTILFFSNVRTVSFLLL